MQIEQTEAPPLQPYGNPISLGFLLFVTFLVIAGLVLMYYSHSVRGSVLLILATWLIIKGDTKHKPNPREGGVVHCQDEPVVIDGKFVVVGGRTLLPPFCTSVKLDVTNKDVEFKFQVLSPNDNQVLDCKVSLSMRVNVEDPIDYFQSGEEKGVKKLLDDIFKRETQILVIWYAQRLKWGWKDFYLLSYELEPTVYDSVFVAPSHRKHEKVSNRGFGVLVGQIQVDIKPANAKILETAGEIEKERLDRIVEMAEFDTTLVAAKKKLAEYRRDPQLAHVTLQECIEEVRRERQDRKDRSTRVDTSGGGRAIVLAGNQPTT